MEGIQNLTQMTQSLEHSINRKKSGKIVIKTKNPSSMMSRCVLLSLLALTVYAFFSFDYKNIDFFTALSETATNLRVMFFEARATNFTWVVALEAVITTLALGFLTTVFGSVIALFLSFFAARNLSSVQLSHFIKQLVAIIRAVPTVLWVLIFAISVGLGSEAAILGMSFHTIGYLIKAYSEAFEEIDSGVIEALKASGASWWQIIFQAILPSSLTSIAAWTFMRFEINFANAVAMGAAAGAGGIGFELFMSSNFYFNVREVGFITILLLVIVIVLEYVSTFIKNRYLR